MKNTINKSAPWTKITSLVLILSFVPANSSEFLLYNTTTHETVSTDALDGSGWMLLDASDESYAQYTHPAYYNTTFHGVVDSSEGSTASGWILTEASGGGDHGDGDDAEDPVDQPEEPHFLLYNTTTHETVSTDAMDGSGWMLLDASNEAYAQYTHPAYYNTTFHGVVDSSEGSTASGWILTEASGGGDHHGDGDDPEDPVDQPEEPQFLLYNTATHETIFNSRTGRQRLDASGRI